jgi:hypothetical protein
MSERSRMPLHVRELPEARVGLPAVGLLNVRARDVLLKQIQRLDGDINKAIGVERWRSR